MTFYNTIVTIHIICVGIWITNGIAGPIFKKLIASNKESSRILINFFLKYTNIAGMIGSMGLLLTGILMVIINPAYGFFQFSANHWLAAKQIIMIIILALVFSQIIPTAKNIRLGLNSESMEETMMNVGKLGKVARTVLILVIVNILFAISRSYM